MGNVQFAGQDLVYQDMKYIYEGKIVIETFYETTEPSWLDNLKYFIWEHFMVIVWKGEYKGLKHHLWRFRGILDRMKFYKIISIEEKDGRFITMKLCVC